MPSSNINPSNGNSHHADRTKDKIANAIPLTFGFLALLGLILLGQDFLSKRKPESSTIILAYEQGEQKEEVDYYQVVNTLADIDLDLAYSIIKQFIKGNNNSQKLIEQVNALNPTEDNRNLKTFHFVVQSLLHKKDHAMALSLLEKLSDKERIDNDLDFTYALLLSKVDDNKKATIQFYNFLQREPTNQAAVVNLGLLYLQQDKYQKALDLFQNGLTFASGSHKAKMYAGLGDAKFALGLQLESIDYYKKSIEYRPTHSLTWRKLARAEKATSQPINIVILSYQKAFALSPKNSSLQIEFANYLFEKMKHTKVTRLLKKNLIQSKASIKERILLVVSYIERRRLANAKKQLGYLKTHTTRKLRKQQVKGLDYYLQRNYQEVIALLKATLKKNRNNNLAYYFIGRSYQKLGKPKNSLVYFGKIDNVSIYYNSAQFRAGLASIESNNSPQAENIFEQLFSRLPQNDEIAYSVAKLAYAKKDYTVAYSAISRAILTLPEKKQYRLMEIKIRWKMGERKNVFTLLSDLLDKNPSYKPALYRLSNYLLQANRIDESAITLKKLIELDPDYSKTQLKLARIYFSKKSSMQQALPLVEAYLERKSADVKARSFYAQILCTLKLIEKCKQQLDLIDKLDPNNKEASSIKSFYF
ncbi:MAG: tetratricopeptide repeat protein [Enterobacterales bacterium]|nr:tetratricopeptide repeat protein [Enterobacterales bacterium]